MRCKSALTDHADSPFDSVAHREVQHRVEEELRKVPEPYRTTLILRDLEEMSYEEIAEVLAISLGTVKSRITRGRDALRQRLALTEPGYKATEERIADRVVLHAARIRGSWTSSLYDDISKMDFRFINQRN